MQQIEKLKACFKIYPATLTILIINVLVFLIMTLDGGSTDTNTLLKYGALSKDLVANGDWWRLGTLMFLHIGTIHIIFNMLGLLILGTELEKLVGTIKFLVIYLVSGIGASLSVYFFGIHNEVGAGASGSLFGLLGAFLAIAITKSYHLSKDFKQSLILALFLNTIVMIVTPFISTEGHVGGLVTGLVLSFLILNRKTKDRTACEE